MFVATHIWKNKEHISNYSEDRKISGQFKNLAMEEV